MTIILEPPFDLVGISQFGRDRAERGVLRIAGPIRCGKTLIKRGPGDWYCKRTPSQMELDAAVMYFLGGHVYEVDQDTVDEILASVGPDCIPSIRGYDGMFPGPDTHPSLGTFSGSSG